MLFIVCALSCEASSLISHFHLKPYHKKSPFPIYLNASILLIISGVGKIQVATAVGYLQGLQNHLSHIAWLNVGIAGHASLPLGTGILGHQIIDQTLGRIYYPVFVTDRPVQTATVRTVDKEESLFNDPCSVYEMEASSFWSAASRFSTAELIHCYKVVSDNQSQPTSHLTGKLVENLMKEHLSNISTFINDLLTLSHSLSNLEISINDIEPYLQRWHFTVTQQIQLKSLLNRWKACASLPLENLWNRHLLAQTHSRQVLQYLESQLKTLPFQLNQGLCDV